MQRYWFVGRLSVALTMLVLSLLFAAFGLGLVPDAEAIALDGRSALARVLGLQAAAAVESNDPAIYEATLKQVLADNPELASAGLRDTTGELAVDVGRHGENWVDPGAHSNVNNVWLSIDLNDAAWGRAEFAFRPLPRSWLGGLWPGGVAGKLFAFLGVTCCGIFGFYLWYVLGKVLADSGAGVPQRVKQALDALAEGVLILDRKQRIAHSNLAFSRITKRKSDELIGRGMRELGWSPPRGVDAADVPMPWDAAAADGNTRLRVPVVLKSGEDSECMLSCNATLLLSDDGQRRGMLATFDDLTELERKNSSLHELLQKLKHSRAEIHRQNQELKLLATRDPLTLCLNRRAFFAELLPLYEQAARTGAALSCMLIDVDRFKQVNDRHGHPAGDQVLFQVAELLRQRSRNTDLVCRYGGEEFAVILPQTDLEAASVIAERIRAALAEKPLAGIAVTASFGLCAVSLGPNGPQGLLDQADKALYSAKRSGRNMVVRSDELTIAENDGFRDQSPSDVQPCPSRTETAIPYPAVTALISALAYRDALTAEHSRRVADLCLILAKDILSQSDTYLLEVAALLHDIGKLGVPDSILFKPGPLNDEEWKVMRLHDRMGIEIITAAFATDALTRIVSTHHSWYGGSPRDSSLPTGDAIPLPARILALADAYDSMVSDRAYRKGRTRDEAFAELRRCAGTQFDPVLVEKVVLAIRSADPAVDDLLPDMSKEAALLIGTQIERLAGAIDERNVPALAAMASQLLATARECGVVALVDVAGRLETAAAGQADWVSIVALTHDLLELCRSTQSVYLRGARATGTGSLPNMQLPAAAQLIERRPDPILDTLTAKETARSVPFVMPPVPEEIVEEPTEKIRLSPEQLAVQAPTDTAAAQKSTPKSFIVTLH